MLMGRSLPRQHLPGNSNGVNSNDNNSDDVQQRSLQADSDPKVCRARIIVVDQKQ